MKGPLTPHDPLHNLVFRYTVANQGEVIDEVGRKDVGILPPLRAQDLMKSLAPARFDDRVIDHHQELDGHGRRIRARSRCRHTKVNEADIMDPQGSIDTSVSAGLE